MLDHLAKRDGSIELSRGAGDAASPVVRYRSRVFEVMADGCIVVETPRQAVQDKAFRVGQDLELTLISNSDRMVAVCTLHELFSYEVNPKLRVTCFRLSPGRRPAREQRRSFYRVSVAAVSLEPVKLRCSIDPDGDDGGEATLFECEGKLSNISAGGLGVSIRAGRDVLSQAKRTRLFDCSASLGEELQIELPVRVVYISALGEDGLYLGLRFEIEDEAEAEQIEQKMQHRCTEIQRMQLQRRRA